MLSVRSQGYALIDQELEEGIRSVAAPLCDRRGRTFAAVNVGTHAARVTFKELRGVILPDLLATARSIESATGQAVSEPSHPLVERVMTLVDQLRRRGIDVTTGAAIDAIAALTHLPLDEPASVKAGLRATLVKSRRPHRRVRPRLSRGVRGYR